MSHDTNIMICGDIGRGVTLAEIEYKGRYVASVFETDAGWQVELSAAEGSSLPLDTFVSAVTAAKTRLSGYVNRRGENPPEGLSDAGFSLWLMQKPDGTAMDVKLQ